MPGTGTRLITSIALAMLLLAATAVAADEAPRDIVNKSLKSQVFEMAQVKADLSLTDLDSRKNKRVRKIRVKAKQGKDELSKSILHFLVPDDVKGTGFLVVERKGADDDQFLYLPALKKIKRIRSDQKSSAFMGTQYSYGDLQSRDADDNTYKMLPGEKLGNFDCWVIESTPKRPDDEQYSRTITWIAKKNYVPLRMKMFDKKGREWKVFTTEKVDVVDGLYVITSSTMLNLKNKRSTRMVVDAINTKVQLEDSEFTQTRLEKM